MGFPVSYFPNKYSIFVKFNLTTPSLLFQSISYWYIHIHRKDVQWFPLPYVRSYTEDFSYVRSYIVDYQHNEFYSSKDESNIVFLNCQMWKTIHWFLHRENCYVFGVSHYIAFMLLKLKRQTQTWHSVPKPFYQMSIIILYAEHCTE